MYDEKRYINDGVVQTTNILDNEIFCLDVKYVNKTDLTYVFVDKHKKDNGDAKLEFVIGKNGRVKSFTNNNFDILRILRYSLNIENGLKDDDYGLSDPLFFAMLVSWIDIKKLIIPDYFPNGVLSVKDYFDINNPTKEDFLKFLELDVSVQEKLIVVPVTVKDHFSTLFIDPKEQKLLYLFDSGLLYTKRNSIEEEEQRINIEKILFNDSSENANKLSDNDLLITKLDCTINPNAREFIFGENLAKDIICLNNYCLQDDYSCGYWTIAACEIGSSEEYNDVEKIKKDCDDGIFQVKLAKRVLEITDDIKKGAKQNIILINPEIQSSNVDEYNIYKKADKTVFIKNIKTENIIGVDLKLLEEQITSKGYILTKQGEQFVIDSIGTPSLTQLFQCPESPENTSTQQPENEAVPGLSTSISQLQPNIKDNAREQLSKKQNKQETTGASLK